MVVILFLFYFLFHPPAFSAEQDDILKNIQVYNTKLIEIAKEKDTLSRELKRNSIEYSIKEQKIKQTELEIISINEKIKKLTDEISQLNLSIDQLTLYLIERIKQSYRLSKKLPPYAFIFSNSFNDYLNQYKYISVVQLNNRQNIEKDETLRQESEKLKHQLSVEQNQKKLEEEKLIDQKNELIAQKTAKSKLLATTKNDESTYQRLKSIAEQELATILAAKFTGKRDVKKGDVIGIMGNTGFSKGAHLHFGLYNLKESDYIIDNKKWQYVNDIDPMDYIKSNRWPFNGDIDITQSRGKTPFSHWYSDDFHHGIDMVSINTAVLAVNDGVAYVYRNASSSLGNHVKIFHPDGKMTLYLHLQ